jgi:integral membrane protein (TIGR01906 family)
MKKPNESQKNIIGILIAILVPLSLLLTSTRLVLTNTFVQIEYRMPNFPADNYGMTMQERSAYAPIALEFLLNNEDISFLADQKFADGSPQYNQRELKHMGDVKDLTQVLLIVWQASLALLVGIVLWARKANWLDDYKHMLSKGGKLTLYLLGAVLLFALLSFRTFFTSFHGLFFEGDTWLFLYSDTLIRLFPIRFWSDVVFVIGGLSISGALILWRKFRK